MFSESRLCIMYYNIQITRESDKRTKRVRYGNNILLLSERTYFSITFLSLSSAVAVAVVEQSLKPCNENANSMIIYCLPQSRIVVMQCKNALVVCTFF